MTLELVIFSCLSLILIARPERRSRKTGYAVVQGGDQKPGQALHCSGLVQPAQRHRVVFLPRAVICRPVSAAPSPVPGKSGGLFPPKWLAAARAFLTQRPR